MCAYRVTQSTAADSMQTGLQAALSRLQAIQEHLSSGRQISRPSDSPSGTADAMQYRGSLRRAEQYERNAADGLGWLGTLDQTLSSSIDLVNRVRDLVAGAVNGSMDAQGRTATASEIDSIRQGLIELANTRYLDRPVLAGNSSTNMAYDSTGAFLGDDGTVMRTVAEGVNVPVNLSGEAVFGSPGGGAPRLFDLLSQISADLRSGNVSQLSTVDLDAIDTARRLMQDQLSSVGARYNRIESMQNRAQDVQLSLRSNLSEVEDIDLPKTLMDLQLQQMAYQSALAAGARVVQPSLVDFLR